MKLIIGLGNTGIEYQFTPHNAGFLAVDRIAERGSANGHNGVKSISGALGTEEWLRIRIGVGKQPLADGTEIKAGGKDYLLSPMRKQELALLDGVLDRVRNAVEVVLTKGVGAAMNEFNRTVDG